MQGRLFWYVLTALCLASLVPSPSARAADIPARGILGDASAPEACTKCHDEPALSSIFHTAHMVKADPRTRVESEGCQNCHGDSSGHAAIMRPNQVRPAPGRVFKGPHASPVDVQNEACVGCHQGGPTMHWPGSAHAASDIACTSCHQSHAVRDPVLVKVSQPVICFTCHADRRADALKPSHHPVLEGRMACSDCHNPHGTVGPSLLKAGTVNDTCLTCHDEKRGPFLWEHAPVQEQCTICHTPHGSVQQTLLKQRVPYLCQDCHDSSQHNSQPFSGTNLPGSVLPSRQLVQRACLNCHSEIHGSNHPGGVRLTR